jgi:hypothetical protein
MAWTRSTSHGPQETLAHGEPSTEGWRQFTGAWPRGRSGARNLSATEGKWRGGGGDAHLLQNRAAEGWR